MIYEGYGGSISYGTNTQESDVDIRGIFIPDKHHLLGLSRIEQLESKEGKDEVYYALDKYISLALKCNPNILELLFIDEQHIIHMSQAGEELRSMRKDFFSKRAVFKAYGGYAMSQLSRMDRVDNSQVEGKRKKLIDTYSYDTKNAMHIFRLIDAGIEILESGNLTVLANEQKRQFYLQIKQGKFSKEILREKAMYAMDSLDQAYKLSCLADEPKKEQIEDWLVETQMKWLNK